MPIAYEQPYDIMMSKLRSLRDGPKHSKRRTHASFLFGNPYYQRASMIFIKVSGRSHCQGGSKACSTDGVIRRRHSAIAESDLALARYGKTRGISLCGADIDTLP